MNVEYALNHFIKTLESLIKEPCFSPLNRETQGILNQILTLATLVQKINNGGGIKNTWSIIKNIRILTKIKNKSKALGVKSLADLPFDATHPTTDTDMDFYFDIGDLDFGDFRFRGIPPVIDPLTQQAAKAYIFCIEQLLGTTDLAKQFSVLPIEDLIDFLMSTKACIEDNIRIYEITTVNTPLPPITQYDPTEIFEEETLAFKQEVTDWIALLGHPLSFKTTLSSNREKEELNERAEENEEEEFISSFKPLSFTTIIDSQPIDTASPLQEDNVLNTWSLQSPMMAAYVMHLYHLREAINYLREYATVLQKEEQTPLAILINALGTSLASDLDVFIHQHPGGPNKKDALLFAQQFKARLHSHDKRMNTDHSRWQRIIQTFMALLNWGLHCLFNQRIVEKTTFFYTPKTKNQNEIDKVDKALEQVIDHFKYSP